MALAPKLVTLFPAIACADWVAFADTGADLEIERVGQVRHDSARQGDLTVSQRLCESELIAYALVQTVLSKTNNHSVIRACFWLEMCWHYMLVHPSVIDLSVGENRL